MRNTSTMTYSFTHPTQADLPRIMEIENAGFSPESAATEVAMQGRIDVINDSFILARDANGTIAGYIVGPVSRERYITDDLFSQSSPNPATGGVQTVLSLAVHPDYRGLGVARALVERLIGHCQTVQREAISLTCLANLVPFYEDLGFVNEGESASEHGGEVWYNLVREL